MDHYLDTSVLQSIQLGTNRTKEYYKNELSGHNQHISNYVIMEFKRGFIQSVLEFCQILKMSTVSNIGDAMKVWSQKFSTRGHKNLLSFIGELVDANKFDRNIQSDKEKAFIEILRQIKLIDNCLINDYKLCNDATRCSKAKVSLSIDLDSSINQLENVLERFNNDTHHRRKCSISKFILNKYRHYVKNYINYKNSMVKSHNIGFFNIAENLETIVNEGEDKITCTSCKKIGDAVIALNCPKKMRLETVDNSFDLLCSLIKNNHKLHPSTLALHKP